jgi:hypothetical protein
MPITSRRDEVRRIAWSNAVFFGWRDGTPL